MPHRVGTESSWNTISGGGWFYHVLKKKDGSLWELRLDPDRKDPGSDPAQPRKLEVPGEVIAFSASSGQPCGVAINDLGEVWTWGRVFAVHTSPNRALETLSRFTRSFGWRVDWGSAEPVLKDKPWRLPLE